MFRTSAHELELARASESLNWPWVSISKTRTLVDYHGASPSRSLRDWSRGRRRSGVYTRWPWTWIYWRAYFRTHSMDSDRDVTRAPHADASPRLDQPNSGVWFFFSSLPKDSPLMTPADYPIHASEHMCRGWRTLRRKFLKKKTSACTAVQACGISQYMAHLFRDQCAYISMGWAIAKKGESRRWDIYL